MTWNKQDRVALAGIYIFVYLSGLGLYAFSKWIRIATAIGEQRHPWEQTVRVIHTSVTYLSVIALGYLLGVHVLPKLKSKARLQFPSGISLIVIFLLLTMTAVTTLYAGEGWLTQVHIWVGFLSPIVLIAHVVRASIFDFVAKVRLMALSQFLEALALGRNLRGLFGPKKAAHSGKSSH